MPTEETFDPNGFGLGWRKDEEPKHENFVASVSVSVGDLPCAAASEADIPNDMIPDWFTQNNQGSWPFCHAHMRTGMEECLAWLETKGTVYQFSRAFAAIMDMRMDGDDRYPEGASIGGSLKSAIRDGAAMEPLLPYFPTGKYSNKVPETVKADALTRRIHSLIPNIRSYSALDKILTSGRGAVGFGMDWTTGWAAFRGVDQVAKMPGGRVLGGHALFFFGWKKIAGERWPFLHNSHAGWGVHMRTAVAPRVIDYILQNSRYGAYGATNIVMNDPSDKIVQPWDWITTANFQSAPVNPFV